MVTSCVCEQVVREQVVRGAHLSFPSDPPRGFPALPHRPPKLASLASIASAKPTGWLS